MSTPESQPRRVLIAEDTPSMSALMRHWLVERGYTVAVVETGEQCLVEARASQPALLILDIMLPGVHGMEVLRRLKADPATGSLAVLMCTARHYKPDLDQATELGAAGVLVKPLARDQFLAAVEQVLTGQPQAPALVAAAPAEEFFSPTLAPGQLYVRLWGTRGSIPVSGHRYVRHGGNTSCVEVGCGQDVLILDAGSGIRDLGLHLAKNGPRALSILITHTHWDHIQGFPFFVPAYVPGSHLVFYGATGFGKDLASVFHGQLDRDYFPVQFEDMRARIEFRHLETPPLRLGQFTISWEYTHHPAATVGYKIEVAGRKIAYVSDNEFLYGYLGSPHAVTKDHQKMASHRRLVDFLEGVDLLIAEAQYTNEEYRSKIGWGHSSLSNACALARLAGVKRWFVTHHDPLHDDEFLDAKLNLTRSLMRSLDPNILVCHAYDGMMEYV